MEHDWFWWRCPINSKRRANSDLSKFLATLSLVQTTLWNCSFQQSGNFIPSKEQRFQIYPSKDEITPFFQLATPQYLLSLTFCAIQEHKISAFPHSWSLCQMTPSLHQPSSVSRATGGFGPLVLLGDICRASMPLGCKSTCTTGPSIPLPVVPLWQVFKLSKEGGYGGRRSMFAEERNNNSFISLMLTK